MRLPFVHRPRFNWAQRASLWQHQSLLDCPETEKSLHPSTAISPASETADVGQFSQAAKKSTEVCHVVMQLYALRPILAGQRYIRRDIRPEVPSPWILPACLLHRTWSRAQGQGREKRRGSSDETDICTFEDARLTPRKPRLSERPEDIGSRLFRKRR